MLRLPEMVRQFIDRRWVLRSLASIIAPTSLFFFLLTLRVVYFDYWLEPKEKAADIGLYIYPQIRYTVFYAVLASWCATGIVASVTSFRSATSSESVSEWTHRSLILYFILFVVLILGGTLMMVVRRYAY